MSSQTHARETARNQAGSLRDIRRTTFEQQFGGEGAVEGEKDARKVSCGHLGLHESGRARRAISVLLSRSVEGVVC
jgi:hypothetical protein